MAEPTSESLLEQFHYCSIIIGRAHHSSDAAGFHHGQSRLLSIIARHERIGQNELAREMGIRAASVGELLGKLERNGYISRSTNVKDKRQLDVSLTPIGRSALGDYSNHENTFAETVFASLTDEERTQLARLLGKITASLSERYSGATDNSREHHRRRFGIQFHYHGAR